MRTLTDKALNKLANYYISKLKNVKYTLDGEEKEIDFFSKKVIGKTSGSDVVVDEKYK